MNLNSPIDSTLLQNKFGKLRCGFESLVALTTKKDLTAVVYVGSVKLPMVLLCMNVNVGSSKQPLGSRTDIPQKRNIMI